MGGKSGCVGVSLHPHLHPSFCIFLTVYFHLLGCISLINKLFIIIIIIIIIIYIRTAYSIPDNYSLLFCVRIDCITLSILSLSLSLTCFWPAAGTKTGQGGWLTVLRSGGGVRAGQCQAPSSQPHHALDLPAAAATHTADHTWGRMANWYHLKPI